MFGLRRVGMMVAAESTWPFCCELFVPLLFPQQNHLYYMVSVYVDASVGSEQAVLTQQQQAIINQQAIILVCRISSF